MKLLIASRGVANKIIKSSVYNLTHIVSIGADEPPQRPPYGLYKCGAKVLRLEFFDIHIEHRDKMNGPSKKDISKLVTFFQEALKENDPFFLIHCWAGKSRSTAAGLILLKMIYKDDLKAREELFRLVPQAIPNTRMMDLFEELLKDNVFEF